MNPKKLIFIDQTLNQNQRHTKMPTKIELDALLGPSLWNSLLQQYPKTQFLQIRYYIYTKKKRDKDGEMMQTLQEG